MKEKRPIIALDFSNLKEVKEFLGKFDKEKLYVKIGMELFYSQGPTIVDFVKTLGHNVFLDLKLHDIPNTVKSAIKVIAGLGVDMTNVHAAGGLEMMLAAREGLAACHSKVKLIAVTQLTSTSEAQVIQDQQIFRGLQNSVLHYAQRAEAAGLDGVVCSAFEAKKVKKVTHSNFICLTPGIRPDGAEQADQKRIVTPAQAKQFFADFIVVGRPITQAENPQLTYKQIFEEWNKE